MCKTFLANSGLLTTTDEILTTITPTRGTPAKSFITTVGINIEPSTTSTQAIMETKTSPITVVTTATMITSAIPLVTTSATTVPVTAIQTNIGPSYDITSTHSSLEITSSSAIVVTQTLSVISPSTSFDYSTLKVTSIGKASTTVLTSDRLLTQTGSKNMMLATISFNISLTCKSSDYIQIPYRCLHFM